MLEDNVLWRWWRAEGIADIRNIAVRNVKLLRMGKEINVKRMWEMRAERKAAGPAGYFVKLQCLDLELTFVGRY